MSTIQKPSFPNYIFSMFRGIYVFLLIFLFLPVTRASEWTLFPTPSSKIHCLEVAPEGVLAGEFDDRAWLYPYNGIYLSSNEGQTWQKIGLEGKGVKNMKYKDGVLMASAFYTSSSGPRGLYLGQYPYSSWRKVGPNYEVTSTNKCGVKMYMGTKINGLLVSEDGGETWVQKIGTGWEGPEIITIYCDENIVLASGRSAVFSSTDSGETWTTLPFFNNNTIYSFTRYAGGLAASGAAADGIYISQNGGTEWKLVRIINYDRSKSILGNGQYLYIGDANDVVVSLDSGNDAAGTGLDLLNNRDVLSMAIHRPAGYKILVLNSSGVMFQRDIDTFLYDPFLSPPWNIENENELFEKINSYFDHKFPLLAYPYYREPTGDSSTTLRFDGISGKIPEIYYSSHSGTDFDLLYGNPVLAAAGGIAEYYYCKDCGHSIKINHGNGYQTIYMHLQEDTLVKGSNTAQVNEGDFIGYVGLTGRTTGPHLHFEVVKDTDGDGSFSDEFPHGRTDPYGWDYSKAYDPWPSLNWSDVLGTHTGTISKNLWTTLYPGRQETPLRPGNTLTIGNKVIEILENTGEDFLNLVYEYAPAPAEALKTAGLEFIKGTSFVLNAVDQLGNIYPSNARVLISIKLPPETLLKFVPETIKVLRWAEETSSWVETVAQFNSLSGTVESVIDHFSYFALFGERNPENNVHTELCITPDPYDGYVPSPPTITLTSTGSLTLISLNGGDTWQTYTEPVFVSEPAMYDIMYKSADTSGYWEETNSYVLTVGPNLITSKIRVSGTLFVTEQSETKQ